MRFSMREILSKREKRYLDATIYSGVFGSSLDPRAMFRRLCAIITLVGFFQICLVSTKKLSVALAIGRLRSYASVPNGMVRGWTAQV